MPRALWKGAISFGLVNVPVELHSAQKRAASLDLTMLDKRDLAPVGYQRVNKESGKEVPWKEVVKGYEYKDDEYVVLSAEDFRRANPEATKTVDIQAFVDLASIAPQHFETPYYLVPAKHGEKGYALLRDTLEKAGKAGIATVVIRTKQYLAALIAQDELLVLNTLRYADELKEPSELKVPKAKVTAKERDMALRLVKDMEDEWRPARFHDTYREDILKRIKEKVKAGETEEITAPEKAREKGAEVIDLMAALKKSIADKPKKYARKRRAA
ncbi:MAG: end-binding protein Ku [Betaproteobacteria bacterium]|jgi:DNA end-binding protein Ku|nr:end-binding protein Ku [Betaproteobacteria bacterium]